MTESYYLLEYEVAADYKTRRGEFRDAHLTVAWAASDRDEMILGGPVDGDIPIGLMLFRGTSAAVAESFAKADPYTVNGLVKKWRVREWITTVGRSALAPDRPQSSS